ncbi:hypothetical protein ACNKHV_20715 [Shigella flexneri]
MFNVLMCLFETYIHTEAELRVDQDKLNRILPTQVLIEKISTMPCFGWKLADYQEGLAEPMQLASNPLSMHLYP